MIRRLGLALSLLCASAGSAAAQTECVGGTDGAKIMGRSFGLSGVLGTDYTMQTFTGLPGIVSRDPVTTLAASGFTVSVSGAYFGDKTDSFYQLPFNDALYNYPNFASASKEFAFSFSTGISAVAFNYSTFPNNDLANTSTFSLWKNGAANPFLSIATTFPNQSAGRASCFWGFAFSDGTTFDRLTISSSNSTTFALDNLELPNLVTTVPEPSTVGLLGVGLLSLAAFARRRRGPRA